jgi:hypothetical protein
MTLRITGFMDFVHRPIFRKLENTTFLKLDQFPSSGERGRTPAQLGPIERASLDHWRTPVRLTTAVVNLMGVVP